jgi:hypothetical protein
LTLVNIALGIYSLVMFLKIIVTFGLPNHPARLTTYLVTFCATAFFCSKAATAMGLLAPWFWIKYRSLPMVAGSLSLLLQVIMMMGNFSLIQQKVVSRLPLIAALLCLAFFPEKADFFIGAAVVAGCVFLTVSVGKARYQKRMFFKLTLFLALFYGLNLVNEYWVTVIAELMMFGALFYFYIFEQSFGVAALVDDHFQKQEG